MNKRAEATRNKIIDGAIKCYAELGVQGSSMDIIAERAGATKPTLYAHFGSKEKLYDAVLVKMMGELLEEDDFKYDPSRDPISQMTDILNDHFNRSMEADNLKFYRALLVETIRRDEDVPGYNNSKKEMLMREWFKDAVDDGVIEIDNIETTTNNLLAIVSGRFYYPIILGVRHFTVEELEKELGKSLRTFFAPILK